MRLETLLKLLGLSYVAFSMYVLLRVLTGDGTYVWIKGNTQINSHSNSMKVSKSELPTENQEIVHSVEIWGKAAIGLYLWQHVFEAPLESMQGDYLKYGKMKIQNIVFNFRTGPMLIPQSVDYDAENVVLFINGREPEKVKFALTWLEAVKEMTNVGNFAVVLLGNEQCQNEWLMPYMKINGGFIKLAFIIYDVPYIDDRNFHPWPLGVATYRNFPVVQSSHLILQHRRRYICNFLGTVYEDSSRTELVKIINSNEEIKSSCLIHTRNSWVPSETKGSSELYQNSMRDSDLTLCPVGKNTECYRIYEAMSFGSVPIVEDVITPGKCGQSSPNDVAMVPLRLLKRMNAPIIYIKTWKELPSIIANEKKLPYNYVVKRRKQLIHWYQKFKYNLREYFVKQLKKGFKFH